MNTTETGLGNGTLTEPTSGAFVNGSYSIDDMAIARNQQHSSGSENHNTQTRVIHMRKPYEFNTGRLQIKYDPMIGIQTGAILGGALFLLVLYTFYKYKCKRTTWTSADDIYLEYFRQKIAERDQRIKSMKQNARKAQKDSINTPVKVTLEATAIWIQNQPLDFIPDRSAHPTPAPSMMDLQVGNGHYDGHNKNLCNCHGMHPGHLKSNPSKGEFDRDMKRIKLALCSGINVDKRRRSQSLPGSIGDEDEITDTSPGDAAGTDFPKPASMTVETHPSIYTTKRGLQQISVADKILQQTQQSQRPTQLYPDNVTYKKQALLQQTSTDILNNAPNPLATSSDGDLSLPPLAVSGDVDLSLPPLAVSDDMDLSLPPLAVSDEVDLSLPPLAVSGDMDLSLPPLAVSGDIDLSLPPLAVSGDVDLSLPPPISVISNGLSRSDSSSTNRHSITTEVDIELASIQKFEENCFPDTETDTEKEPLQGACNNIAESSSPKMSSIGKVKDETAEFQDSML